MEFALILPVMMLLLLIAIDFGRLFYLYVGVTNAAREGAAYAAQNPSNASGITARARQELGNDANLGVSYACSVAGCPSSQSVAGPDGDLITVYTKEAFSFLTPVVSSIVGSSLWVGASSTLVIP